MNFFNKIENLQKKPESYRKKFLAVSVLIFMCAVIFVWLTTFDFSLGAKAEQMREAYTPFEIIGKDFAGIKDNLKASVGEIKGMFNQTQNGEK